VEAKASLESSLSALYLHTDSGKNWGPKDSRILFLNKRRIVCMQWPSGSRCHCSVPEKDFIISLPAVSQIRHSVIIIIIIIIIINENY